MAHGIACCETVIVKRSKLLDFSTVRTEKRVEELQVAQFS